MYFAITWRFFYFESFEFRLPKLSNLKIKKNFFSKLGATSLGMLYNYSHKITLTT
nr:MAG TPA: hypothetical protein [Caudoviricetes sp.]